MDIVAILTMLMPLVLQVINKPTDTPEQKAEMLAIGNDMLAIGISAELPIFRLCGQFVICASKADEAGKAKLMAIAAGVDRMAQAQAERASKGA